MWLIYYFQINQLKKINNYANKLEDSSEKAKMKGQARKYLKEAFYKGAVEVVDLLMQVQKELKISSSQDQIVVPRW